ncbi:MAG: DNA-directed RNA polymerase subunit beta' [Firmicutes bacterium]|nr:DNA-directed RNA polymerase subunit beta' [Bacillota bacterium]
MLEANRFDRIRIALASPDQVRAWSSGEVKKPETINYRTLKPEREGLFCERIFGPTKDWECHCGKYKRIRHKGIVCDRCGVEVTRAKVRRERMGHIELAAPASHIWYFKGIPSRMGLILDMSPRLMEKVLYFAAYVVTDPGQTPLVYKQILSEAEYREYRDEYGAGFQADMGAEAIRKLLAAIELDELAAELRQELKNVRGQRKIRAIRRLEVVEAFRKSGNRPEWMILDVIPVIPPELRPMVQLDGGRFATSDLNDLYRRVINRNNRLKRLLELQAPDIIVRNEKRMLQEAVDALIDNGRRGRPVTGPGNRALKSLSDLLKGKQGRFRQNLLGKRVDYSGRSVIVVGPDLAMHQCGLPKEMALELFKPFVMKELVERELANNIKSAKRMVERVREEVWDVLENVIEEHPVMLNRAPTLHRLGIQAFEPVLVEGRAIQIHPLVCSAYNADFDGDQMAVHVPLSAEAQAEARVLMLSAYNILSPANGRPLAVPTQDMVIGIYYLTSVREDAPGAGRIFTSAEEAEMAHDAGELSLQALIKVWLKDKLVETTLGRLIFNQALPEGMYGDLLNEVVDKKMLGKIVSDSYYRYGIELTVGMLDRIKALGFHYATMAGITISIDDTIVPTTKTEILAEADRKIEEIEEQYRTGLVTADERYQQVIKIWNEATDKVTESLVENLDPFNPVFMMATSGARGNIQQLRQLAGMRGLMADPSGRIIDLPIRSNFHEGLTVLEYFISTHGARKGLADTALRTADSGYLTRRLVDVSQDVIVREEDCGTSEGFYMTAMFDGNEELQSLSKRIVGRIAAEDVVHPETGEVLILEGEEISTEVADVLTKVGIEGIRVRTVLQCRTKNGVCAKCYGRSLATGRMVDVGEAVGIVAAQSIGEPGTQLTMRTFHTGGVAGDDITQGLPRVEELFEARKPKNAAVISDMDGAVHITENRGRTEIQVVDKETGEAHSFAVPHGARVYVKEGQSVLAGEQLTEGPIDPHELLRIKGMTAVQAFLLHEVQRVYRFQGVEINDKHIEIIVRQMLKKVKVEECGDTELLPGSLVDVSEFEEENMKALQADGEPATARPILLGITKASLATESFLSAASFQETTRVLTDAAIKGKTDYLLGLKENVIIGKLIPAGTGMAGYDQIKTELLSEDEETEKPEELEQTADTAPAAEPLAAP